MRDLGNAAVTCLDLYILWQCSIPDCIRGDVFDEAGEVDLSSSHHHQEHCLEVTAVGDFATSAVES
jgi:hypothetical protein